MSDSKPNDADDMAFNPQHGSEWAVGDAEGESELTTAEKKYIRLMMQKEMRRNWAASFFFRWSRNVAVWVTAIIGAYLLVVEVVLKRLGAG